jgi:hypothetical protein
MLRNVFTTDARRPSWSEYRRALRMTHDDRLEAIPPGKCLIPGTVWRGDLKPLVDARIDSLAPLVTGFTGGNVLHAEPTPAVLNMGRTWTGDLIEKLNMLVSSRQSTSDDQVDLTQVATELEQLHGVLGTQPLKVGQVTDALRRVRRASDAVDPQFTTDSNFRASVRGSHAANAALNATYRQYWSEHAAKTATRDKAPSPRPTAADLNAANRAFWAGRR